MKSETEPFGGTSHDWTPILPTLGARKVRKDEIRKAGERIRKAVDVWPYINDDAKTALRIVAGALETI
jgi:hypothetical protein